MKRIVTIAVAIAALALNLSAQNAKSEPADSLVRLMSAQSAELIQTEGGSNMRKVIGPARFLHNNTYLICDTALWYVETHIIKAYGNVRILQDETVLSSDKLDYYIDEDLAQFRGSVVQLQDKERNTLRTRNLDYNTKDSVAIFRYGASMRDKDGQIIESDNGSYDSKTKIFVFNQKVNMFADSVFVNTDNLIYHGDTQLAEFDRGVDAWKDEDMLSADRGYYDRAGAIFRFYDNVHGMTDTQEAWSDTLHFYRDTKNIDMMGNVQLTDTSRMVSGLAEKIWYVDSTATVTMETDATIVAEIEDTTRAGARDTLYLGADRIVYWTVKMCDVDPAEVSAAEKRLSDMATDPVAEYRKKAAEAAAQAAEEAKRKREEEMGIKPASQQQGAETGGEPQTQPDSGTEEKPESEKPEPEKPEAPPAEKPASSGADPVPEEGKGVSTSELPASGEPASEGEVPPEGQPLPEGESLGEAADSSGVSVPEEPKDTTKVGFVCALGNVRVYKWDMQARCDSLVYNELDSLGRLYLDPIVWNEGNRQYTADSLSVISENGHMRKASLMSNAFITIKEDEVSYDQIRGAEMMAFFDTTTALQRFDALGGASAVFFLEENDALATVNKVDSKMLTANFLNGEIEKIFYYDAPHNDAYPAVQLPSDTRQMKGFRWDPERCPQGKEDVTPYDVRPVERTEYLARPRPVFRETDVYFPGYMAKVYRDIEVRDSLRKYGAPPAAEEPADSTVSQVPDGEEVSVTETAPDNVLGTVLTTEEEPATTPEPASPGEPVALPEPPDSSRANVPSEPANLSGIKPVTEVPEQAGNPSESEPGKTVVEVDLKDLKDYVQSQQKTPQQIAEQQKAAEKAAKAAEKAAKDAEREASKAAKAEADSIKLAAKEAKWAELDAKDAAKAEAKAAKKYEKLKKKSAKVEKAEKKEAAREQKLMDRYTKQYQKKQFKDAVRKANKEAKRQQKAK